MSTQMNFKYRIYPSQKQIIKLNQTLSDCCFVYNKLLETKINAYKIDKISLSKYDLDKIGKNINVKVYAQVKQNISKRINDAFNDFFRRVKQKKGKAGFPRFKSLNRYKSITYPQSGFKIVSERKLFVSQIGNIPIVLDRVPKGKLKTFCIKKTAVGWFAIFSCSDVPIEKIEVENNHIGIDVGIENFATLSNGEVIANPTFLKKSEKKLAKLQRRLSRKKKSSANRRKARIKVARLHERIFNQRNDFLHKTSFSIIKKFKTISVEKLQINNMVKNHHLAKSINDVSWNSFIQMLSYKVLRTGGQLIKVNPRNTSKTCSNCGTIIDMPLSKRTFKCKCGFVCHRDLNASININTAGQAEINACEHDVRPSVKAVLDEAGTIFEPA